MNSTLAVDEQVVKRARCTARALGKSLTQLIREHLAELSAADAPARDVEELRRLSLNSDGMGPNPPATPRLRVRTSAPCRVGERSFRWVP